MNDFEDLIVESRIVGRYFPKQELVLWNPRLIKNRDINYYLQFLEDYPNAIFNEIASIPPERITGVVGTYPTLAPETPRPSIWTLPIALNSKKHPAVDAFSFAEVNQDYLFNPIFASLPYFIYPLYIIADTKQITEYEEMRYWRNRAAEIEISFSIFGKRGVSRSIYAILEKEEVKYILYYSLIYEIEPGFIPKNMKVEII